MEEEVYEEFLKNLSKKIDLKKNGSFSKLIEERDRFLVVGILEKENNFVKICSVSWKKKSFSRWWQEEKNKIPYNLNFKKSDFNMTELMQSQCKDDTWTKLPSYPDGRIKAVSFYYSGYMIVWGGISVDDFTPINTRFKYDLSAANWTEMSTINALTPRFDFGYVLQ